MPNFCSNCGAALADRVAFCSACGTPTDLGRSSGVKPGREAQYNLVGEPINPTQDESAIVHTEHPPSQRGTLLYEIGHALGVRGFMFVILVVAGILFAVWLSQPDNPTKTSNTPLDKSPQLDSYMT